MYVYVTQRELELLVQSIPAFIESAQEDFKMNEALEWRNILAKCLRSLKDTTEENNYEIK